MNVRALQIAVGLIFLCGLARDARAQTIGAAADISSSRTSDQSQFANKPRDVLSPKEWSRVDAAVERALTWLASQQRLDGSFPTLDTGQPAVTSLCVLAFMAHGHMPGDGPYGARLERAVNFITSCQKENGLLILLGPDGSRINRNVSHEIGYTGAYNHGIASLTLAEVYGTGHIHRSSRIQKMIDKALSATLEMQRWPKDKPADRGGWRYINDSDRDDSDLSVTGWNLMFLRSARNAGFNVPKQSIDEAVAYVRRTFSRPHRSFAYTVDRGHEANRGMAGAGILALGHAGFHDSAEAQQAGTWLLEHSFEVYNQSYHLPRDRYHYSLINCCQGMYQLGSPIGTSFFRVQWMCCCGTSRPTAHGMPIAQTATERSEIPIQRRWSSYHWARRTSYCRSFNDSVV